MPCSTLRVYTILGLQYKIFRFQKVYNFLIESIFVLTLGKVLDFCNSVRFFLRLSSKNFNDLEGLEDCFLIRPLKLFCSAGFFDYNQILPDVNS